MQTQPENQSSAASPGVEETPFRLLVVYDSDDAKMQAQDASDFILNEVGDAVVVEKTFWNVRSLGVLSVQEKAVNQAADADVILLALSAQRPTAELMNWTESWLKLRRDSEGLLAVIPTGGVKNDAADLVQYFYETAVSANMDFLCRDKHNRLA